MALKPQYFNFDGIFGGPIPVNVQSTHGILINTATTYAVFIKARQGFYRGYIDLMAEFDAPAVVGMSVSLWQEQVPYQLPQRADIARIYSDVGVIFPLIGGLARHDKTEVVFSGVRPRFIDSEERVVIAFNAGGGLPASRPFFLRGHFVESPDYGEIMNCLRGGM